MDDALVRRGWLTAPLSCLGMVGLSALLSVVEIGQPQKGDVCVISQATGPCGTLAGQVISQAVLVFVYIQPVY